jgi:hypothetical protein
MFRHAKNFGDVQESIQTDRANAEKIAVEAYPACSSIAANVCAAIRFVFGPEKSRRIPIQNITSPFFTFSPQAVAAR